MLLRRLYLCVVLPVIGCSLVSAAEPSVATWPQWRGPSRDGKIEPATWPDKLSEDHLKQVWRVELGPSYSGPIVAGDRVFVTETRDEKTEVVRALDRATGKELWQASWEGSLSVPFFARANGDWIRATPALDGDRLFVAGIRDVLVCVDAANGKELWKVDFVEHFKSPVPAFGFVCSPLVSGDFVYVQAGAGFVKLEKATGKVVWRVLDDGGGMWGSAFSSPYLATLRGQPQLLVQTRTDLAGVEPESGEVLWKREIPAFRGMNIVTPTVYEESIFTSSYGGGSFLIEPDKTGDAWELSEGWKSKVQGYMSTPVVIDGHAYLHLRNQRFTCIDVASGTERWTTKPYGEYWSLVASGDKILALDERGELLLIRATPEKFDLLDTRKVGDDTWAHLAVCGNEVFIRELNAIAVYRWE